MISARISAAIGVTPPETTPSTTATTSSESSEQIVLQVIDPGVPYTLAPDSVIPGDIRLRDGQTHAQPIAGQRIGAAAEHRTHQMGAPMTGALVGAGITAATLLRVSTLSGNRGALWYLPAALLGGGLFGGFIGSLFD